MPAKVIWSTGISGCHRNEHLTKCQKYCAERGKKVEVFPVGEMLFEWAKKNKIHLTRKGILESPPHVLSAIRGGVFENILGRFKSLLKNCDVLILNVHSFFLWKEIFSPAISVSYLKQFNPDLFVTFIDGSDRILADLSKREQWEDQKLTEKDVLYWQNVEVEVTGILADFFEKDFFVIASEQLPQTLYYLLFEPEREPVYVNMPITHLKKTEFEKVQRFIEKLWNYFTVFNPLTIQTGRVKFTDDEVDLSVHHQTVHRDLYWLLRQSKKSIAFFPKVVASPGVFDELKEASETNKDAWVIFPAEASPFLAYFSTKMWVSEKDFFEFIEKRYIPLIIPMFTMENTIKRKCPDGSVGVIHKNKEGKILMQERKTEPLGWAPVAGHLHENDPEKTAIEESSEEVCIKVKKLKKILGPVEIMNFCSRPKDSKIKYNYHDWWIFEAEEWEGKPKSGEPEVVGEVKWFDISEIADLAKQDKLDPAWKILFPMIGIQI